MVSKSANGGTVVNHTHSSFVLAFDLGGSHVSAGLCRLADLQVLRIAHAPLAEIDSFDRFADLFHSLGMQAIGAEKNVVGAALAVPGPFDLENGISLIEHKLKPLYGKSLRNALAARFGWAPQQCRFLNDASAFLLGEVGAGSIRGAARAAGLTLGTGVGSAFAIDGRCVVDGEGVPPGGEIWNFPYRDGTVEDLISTRAIKAEYTRLTGQEKDVSAIAVEAAHERNACRVFETFGSHLGDVLRDVVAPFRPNRVVIGGGITRSAPLFLPIAEHAISGLGFDVLTSILLDEAPLVGAAQFWREESPELAFNHSGTVATEPAP